SARDALGVTVGACAVVAILVNTLLMQSGPHPAPMFKPKPAAVKPVADAIPAVPASHARAVEVVPLPPAKAAPAPAKPAGPAAVRLPGDIINDIQRELARRGFFDGTVDGIYGPKTDGAIRDFEQMAGLK